MASNILITVFFSNCFGQIHLAIKPPSIITAFVHPPSTLAVEFCYSETRACSIDWAAAAAASTSERNRSSLTPVLHVNTPPLYLAFTRYSFAPKLSCTRQSSFDCPLHLHCSCYCNDIARPRRNFFPHPTPLVYAIHHTILAMAILCKVQPYTCPFSSHRRAHETPPCSGDGSHELTSRARRRIRVHAVESTRHISEMSSRREFPRWAPVGVGVRYSFI